MRYTQDEIEILRACVVATKCAIILSNRQLDNRINKLSRLMDEQMIDLKYGKGYTDRFMDELLIQVKAL